MSIVKIEEKGKVLSKQQEQFNKRIERLQKLQDEQNRLQSWVPFVKQKIADKLMPLERELGEARAEIVKTLDFQYDDPFFKPQEKSILSGMIANLGMKLIVEYNIDALKPIYERHAGISYEASLRKELDQVAAMLAKKAKHDFGIDVDLSGIEADSVEEFMAEARARTLEELDNQDEAAREKHEARKQRKAKKKEENPEEKKTISRTVKSIYNELVKHYHPDREQDEEERLRKTAIMQQITVAYEKNDLFTLIQLQLSMAKSGAEKLDKLTDQQLSHYNKILQDQIRDLEIAVSMLKNPHAPYDKYKDLIACKNQKAFEERMREWADEIRFNKLAIVREADTYQDKRMLRKVLKEMSHYF
jgi:hypothetical protein